MVLTIRVQACGAAKQGESASKATFKCIVVYNDAGEI